AKSCTCPGVSRKRSGLPSASTSAWILVLSPPRLRPGAWSATFFESAGAVLMSPHDGAVDHRVCVIAIGCQVLKDALPYAGFGPAAEPPVRILPVAEALRQVAPWDSRTVPVQHRLDKATIVTGGGTDVAPFAGKQVLDPFPLVVAKSIAGQLVRRAREQGPQHVSVRGEPAVVVVSEEEFARMTAARPSIVDHILTGAPWPDDVVDAINARPHDL